MSRKLYRAADYFVIALFVIWFGMLIYLGMHGPTVPDEATGRVYAYNYHGTVVYLNLVEQILQYALPAVGFLTAFVLGAIDRKQKAKNKEWPPPDIFEN